MRLSATFLLSTLLTLCAACGDPQPAAVVFKTQPTNGHALERLSPVEVEVLDANGHVIEDSEAMVSLTLDAKGYDAKISGVHGVKAKNGVARFDSLWITREGIDLQLVASLDLEGRTFPFARSAPFSITPVSDPPVGVAFRGALISTWCPRARPGSRSVCSRAPPRWGCPSPRRSRWRWWTPPATC